MKFLADMGISPATVAFLRERGHDAIHLRDRDMQRLPDPDILRPAWRENRILLTHDLDFCDLVAAEPADFPSVVIFRLRNMRPENVSRHLAAILAEHSDFRAG